MDERAKEILREERKRLRVEEERLIRELERINKELLEIKDSIEAINRVVGADIQRFPKMNVPPAFGNLPVIELVREVLKQTGKILDIAGIMETIGLWGLDNVKETTVRSALIRLVEQPDIERVERGLYRFVPASESTEEKGNNEK